MLSQYLEELKKVRLLSLEHEQQLWHSYKNENNFDARRQLIESYQPLVFKIAARWKISHSIMLDTIQEGTVGLIEAVENYDTLRGVAFSLFATHRIRGRMVNYLKKEKGFEYIPLDVPIGGGDGREESDSFIDFLEDESAEVTAKVEQNYLLKELKSALQRLPQNEQMVLNGVYLNDNQPKELAATMDMSLSYVYRLQKQGIRRLRGMLSRLMGNWQ